MDVLKLLNDQALCARMRSGDEAAFSELYRKYWGDIYQTAYNRLRDKEQCRDIVQNVFTSLWDRRETAEINDLAAYLHTAARQLVFKAIERNPKNSAFLDGFEELITSPLRTDQPLLDKELQLLLQQFINALPRKRREIFIKHYTQHYTTKEIAEQLGISRKTVQNQLNTAEIALRAKMAGLVSFALAISLLSGR